MLLVLILILKIIIPSISGVCSDEEGMNCQNTPSWDDYKDLKGLKKCCNESENDLGFILMDKCHSSNSPGKDWNFDCPPGCTKDIKGKFKRDDGQFEINPDRKLKITTTAEFEVRLLLDICSKTKITKSTKPN